MNYLPVLIAFRRLSKHCANRMRSRREMRPKKPRGQNCQSLDIQAIYKSMRDVKDVMSQILNSINQKGLKKFKLADPIALRCIENFAEDFSNNAESYNEQRKLIKTGIL